MARCYYLGNQPDKGDDIVGNLLHRSSEWLTWIETITLSRRQGSSYSRQTWMQAMEQALIVAQQFNRTAILHHYIKQYEHFNH